MAMAPHFSTCSHCGHALTPENIRLALEDIGEGIEAEKITLCCPGHDDRLGCPGYGDDDGEQMAYWYLI